VLQWVIDANDEFLDQAPTFKPLGIVSVYDEEEMRRLLRPLGRVD
jgi:hypothetical protein